MKRNIIFVLLTFSFVLPLAAQDTIRRADPWYYSEETNPLKWLTDLSFVLQPSNLSYSSNPDFRKKATR